MTKATEVQNLSIAFQTHKNTLLAVDDVSFDINPGETLALLGESGCGKSLTALALMRLLPPQCVYGQHSRVLVNDNDLLNLPERMMRTLRGQKIAVIFQEPMTALNPVLTIGQQLGEAIRLHEPLHQSEIKKKMIALLKEVEIPEPERRLQQYPHQLSGGQKQRIVIAMALAGNPQLLIADEPTTALDVTIQQQVLSLLKRIQKRHQMSLMLITHDLAVVKAMADRVSVMYAGQIVETALVDEFFSQPLHPYSQALLVSLPNMEKRCKRLNTIKGHVPALEAMPQGCRFHPRCVHAFTPCTRIEPELQLQRQRQVRCHLYPEHVTPPAIQSVDAVWLEARSGEDEALLTVRDLSVHFTSRTGVFKQRKAVFKAVDDLSFTINKGKTLALVGESGCGKTTAARALMRLLPIASGSIQFDDKDVIHLRGRTLKRYRKEVQIIFQDPFSSMNPRMTVSEILAEGLIVHGINKQAIKKRQLELLEQVNLPTSALGRYPHQFSGGQRQRICIARALAVTPKLLICDEPTSALDISVQAQILNLLKDLQYEYGLSYLFITHNMAVVSYLADDVLVMKNGQAVEYGSCDAMFKNPQHPYTQKLLSSVLTV